MPLQTVQSLRQSQIRVVALYVNITLLYADCQLGRIVR